MDRVIKQVIVMRGDLKMPKGKLVSQGAHASMEFVRDAIRWGSIVPAKCDNTKSGFGLFTPVQQEWLLSEEHTKITLMVNSEEELMGIHNAAIAAGVLALGVTDLGKTVFNGVPTRTCLAIGPDYADKIDPITKHLKLFQ